MLISLKPERFVNLTKWVPTAWDLSSRDWAYASISAIVAPRPASSFSSSFNYRRKLISKYKMDAIKSRWRIHIHHFVSQLQQQLLHLKCKLWRYLPSADQWTLRKLQSWDWQIRESRLAGKRIDGIALIFWTSWMLIRYLLILFSNDSFLYNSWWCWCLVLLLVLLLL